MTEPEIVDRLVELADANAQISFDALAQYGIDVQLHFRLPGNPKQNGSAWLKELPAPVAGTLEFSLNPVEGEPMATTEIQQRCLDIQENFVEVIGKMTQAQASIAQVVTRDIHLTPDQEQALGAHLVDIEAVLSSAGAVVDGALDFVRDLFDEPEGG